MSAFLWTLTSVVILLFLSMSLVLITPVKLVLEMHTSPSWRMNVGMRLLGGLTPAISFSRDVSRGKIRSARKTRKAKKGIFRRSSTSVAQTVSATLRLLAELFRTVHCDRLSIDADVGLLDPADTGQLFGMITAAAHAMPSTQKVSIIIRPDFAEPRASGRLDAELSFVPLSLIPPSIRFVWRMVGSRR